MKNRGTYGEAFALLRATARTFLRALLIEGAARCGVAGCVLRAAQTEEAAQRRQTSGGGTSGRLLSPKGLSTGNEPMGHRGRKLLIFKNRAKEGTERREGGRGHRQRNTQWEVCVVVEREKEREK
jgi:hypothetical protein